MQKGDGLVIAQVCPNEPIVKDKVVSNNAKPIAKVMDKGKQKVVGIQINEPVIIAKNTLVMSKLELELESARKEKEDLVKELEKYENEFVSKEMTRQFSFVKSTKSHVACTNQGQGMFSRNIAQV